MRPVRFSVVVMVLLAAGTAVGGLEELARDGQWQRVLQVARRRSGQLPLRPGEALIAGFAARVEGETELERIFLDQAAAAGDLSLVAALELALLVAADEPQRAVALALNGLARTVPWQMREGAVAAISRAVETGLDGQTRLRVERAAAVLPPRLRRRLRLALALSDATARRQRLGKLLQGSVSDESALVAARALGDAGNLSSIETWWTAQALYRHALYDEAEHLLGELEGVRHRSIRAAEVEFLRGRCAFRSERWLEAAAWYRKAAAGTASRERRAELEVHQARSLELAGRLDEAVAAAVRAVRLRTTDERRIFLARLRLRQDRPDLALQGISRVRSRIARERGQVLVALHEIRHGDGAGAVRRLQAIRRHPWRGPASCVAARLVAEGGDPQRALALLDAVAADLDPYWAERARSLLLTFPERERGVWLRRLADDSRPLTSVARRRSLARRAALEVDAEAIAAIRAEVARELGLAGSPAVPELGTSVAARLWGKGLHELAVIWDPGGLPRSDAAAALWSAERFLDLDVPWRAIRTADAAWRMAGSQIPVRAFPGALQRSLFPLPNAGLVRRLATRAGAPWTLVAAVVREESRWDPSVVSRVGARGLTQLMPATAAEVADRLGEAVPAAADLHQPHVSLALGAAELARLLAEFDGCRAAAVAAYNAGEAQARLWVEQCGAGCTDEEYLLTIGFSATRTYTRDVLAAVSVYEECYGDRDGTPTERSSPFTESASPRGDRAPGRASARSRH